MRPLTKDDVRRLNTVVESYGFPIDFVEVAINGIKQSITDSYKQDLPIDEEYLKNIIDHWIGNAIFEFKSSKEL